MAKSSTETEAEVAKLCESSDGLLAKNDGNDIEQQAAKSGCFSETVKKTVFGLVIVVLLAVSWVGAQQFAQIAVQMHTFDAPYFITWFGTCWMTLCFPGYVIFVSLVERDGSRIREAVKSSCTIFGTPRVTVKQFFTRIWTMNMLWLGVNYLYIFGLKYIAATDASAIMASNVAFVYILSLCLLHEKFYVIRVLASAFCIGGVVLFAYSEGFANASGVGIAMIIASALGAAVYKVVFKKLVGDATLGQVSLFLTLLGVSNMFIMWVVLPCLSAAGVEHFAFNDIPWFDIGMSSLLSLAFNFLVNFGIAYTYPLFVSIAMMLGIPLNAAVDVIIRSVDFTPVRLLAALLVIVGFGLLLIPDSWNNRCNSAVMCKGGNRGQDNGEERGEPKETESDKNEEEKLTDNA